MRLTQRNVIFGLLLFEVGLGALGLVTLLISTDDLPALLGVGAALPLVALLAWLHWRGWRWAAFINLALITLLTVFFLITPQTDASLSSMLFAPLALALITTSIPWTLAISLGVLAVLEIRAAGVGIYAEPDVIVGYLFTSGALFLSRLVLEQAQHASQQAQRSAEREQALSIQYAEELAAQASALRAQNQRQEQLLALVAVLETPTIQVAAGVLLAPIIGHLDPERAKTLTGRLLRAAADQHVSTMILDISGLSQLDHASAQQLLTLYRGLRLLGVEVILSGIAPAVATTLVSEDIDLRAIQTVPSPHIALAQLLAQPDSASLQRAAAPSEQRML